MCEGIIFDVVISLTALVIGIWYILEVRQLYKRHLPSQHRQEVVKENIKTLGVK